jgi:hypothetical protein
MSDQQERYSAIVAALINEPGVTQSLKKGFAQYGLKVDDKLFVSLIRRGDALILKLPRGRVDWLADSGDGERLDIGHGKAMKEWVIVHADSAVDWLDLAREALAFVREAPAPARRRRPPPTGF